MSKDMRVRRRRRRCRCRWILCAAIAAGGAMPPMTYGKIRQAAWLSATSGTWDVASYWSTSSNYPNNGSPKNTDYTALIAAAGPAYTVTLDTNVTLNSLTLDSSSATLFQTAGTLTLPTLNLSAGTYQLSGGTLRNAAVSGPGTFLADTAAISTLDHVALGTDLSILPPTSGSVAYAVSVRNGLDLLNNATISVGYAGLDFWGTQTLGGTGEVSLDGLGLFGLRSDGGTLTIGPGVRVRTGAGSGRLFTTAGSDRIVNQGTLLADGAGHTLTVSGNWSSTGTLQATNAGQLLLTGTADSLGALRASGGGTITLAGLDYNNSGKTLSADALSGNLTLRTTGTGTNERVTTIHGGTLTSSGAYSLQVGAGSTTSVPGAIFDAATVSGDVSVLSEGELHTTNGVTFGPGGRITLNGAAAQANMTALFSDGTQAWSGIGEIVFDGPSFYSYVAPKSGTLTIGPGITIRSGAQGGAVGEFTPGTLLVNQGTISARGLGKNITVWGNWDNTLGTFEAADDATLYLLGNVTTDQLGTLRTVNNGHITYGGTLDNTNRTFTLDDSTGSLGIYGGTGADPGRVIGGTLAATGSAHFFLNNITLDGVTLTGTSYIGGGSPYSSNQVAVQNNLTLNGNLLIDPAKVLSFPGTQSLLGTGTLAPANTSTAPTLSATDLTIGSGITLRAGLVSGLSNALSVTANGTLTNQGTIAADQPGGHIFVSGTVDNQGTIQAINQGSVWIEATATPNAFNNTGTLRIGAGSWMRIRGSYSADRLGHVENAGTLYLDGALTNPGTLNIDSTMGTVSLSGSVTGGTVAVTGAGSLNLVDNVYFYGVTLDGHPTFAANTLNVNNGLSLTAGTTLTLAGGTLNVLLSSPPGPDGYYISGPGEIVFDKATSYLTSNYLPYATSPDLTVRTGAAGGNIGFIQNAGTILSQTPGATLKVFGDWSNSGLMKATNGGTLNLGGTWSNTGTIIVDPGSTLFLGGTATALGAIDFNGGTTIIGGSLDNTGNTLTFTPASGTIVLGEPNATARINGGTISTSGGTLLDVAYPSILGNVILNGDVSVRPGTVLTLDDPQPSTSPARITLNDSILSVNGAQPLAGPIDVLLNGTPGIPGQPVTLNNVSAPPGSAPLVIGSGVTIRTGASGGRISYDQPFTNDGTLSAETPTQALEIYRVNNHGLVAATNTSNALVYNYTNAADGSMTSTAGGNLYLAGTSGPASTNAGSISADAATVRFVGSWSNAGSISAINGSTLDLGGTWTNTGTIAAADSTLILSTLPASLGAISAARSTITLAGGTLSTAQFSPLTTGGNSVTLNSGTTLDNTGATLDLSDLHLTLLGGTITGGTITSSGNPLAVTRGLLSGGVIVNAPLNFTPPALKSNILTTTDVTFNRPVTVVGDPTQPVTATRLTLNGAWSNTSALSVTNATLVLSPLGSNTGTLTLNDAALTFGSFAGLGNVTRTGGTATFTGTLTNTGSTFDPNLTPVGSVLLGSNARITGGTIASASPVNVVGGGQLPTTLDAVTLAADLNLNGISPSPVGGNASAGIVYTLNGLTFSNAAQISLPGRAILRATGTQTYSGAGAIVLAGGSLAVSSGALTLGPDVTIHTDPATVPIGTAAIAGSITLASSSLSGPGSLVNQGLISADTRGLTLAIFGSNAAGTTLTNQGTLQATNGSTLSLNTLANISNGTLTGGSYRVFADSAMIFPLEGNLRTTITTNAADILLSGPTSIFDPLTPFTTNAGSLTLTDGRTFTTQSGLTNTGTITLGPASVLKVTGDLTDPGAIDLAGGLLLLDYTAGFSPIDQLRADLRDGHVTTSLPDTAVAYVEASLLNLTTYAGLPVDDTTLLTRLTLAGDANLDGRVDSDDYALLDRSYARTLSDAHWTNGDFDYDGQITPADYLVIDTTLARQSGGLSPALLASREARFGPAYVSQLIASVPEPTTYLAAWTLGVMALQRRRRR